MRTLLLLAALALVAGLALWIGRSGGGAAPLPLAAQPAAPAAGNSSALESDPSARKPEAQPAATESNGAPAALAPPQLIDPTSVAGGADGGMPSDLSSA